MTMQGGWTTSGSVFMKFPVLMLCIFVLLWRPTSVDCHPSMSSFVVYQQEVAGDDTVTITNSPLGFLAVGAEPVTFGKQSVGTVFGTASAKTNGTSGVSGTSSIIFLVLDFHIDGTLVFEGTSKYVNGTFIVVGAVDRSQQTRSLAIVGGTGDFLAAKGIVVQSFASGNATSNASTIKNEVMYWCEA